MTDPHARDRADVPLLRTENLTKRFGTQLALDGVSIEVRAGEVHAILGENGAGKSTLMNLLDGLLHPDAGTIFWRGGPIRLHSPRDAQELGIAMVHQHFMLVPALTVAENVLLAHPDRERFLLDRNRARTWIRTIAERHGLRIDPDVRVDRLPVGARQRVEIAKSLAREASLLILDEPTAVLTPGETRDLFRFLGELRGRGAAILFISHKLPEVLELSDRITVLRRGRKTGTFARGEADEARLTGHVLGIGDDATRAPASRTQGAAGRSAESAPPVLEVRGLSRRFPGGPALQDVSFAVRAREILGVTGVDGNGQEELAALLAGIVTAEGGTIALGGADVTHAGIRRRWTMGLAVLPGDRTHEGVVGDLTVWENVSLRDYGAPFARRLAGLAVDPAAHRARAARVLESYDVRGPGLRAKARALSGGNQQKLLLARELMHEPRALVAVNPTRGLDVGAARDVLRRLLALREGGAAVLLISTELEEVLEVADRVAVLSAGRMDEIAHPDRERVGTAMLAGAARA